MKPDGYLNQQGAICTRSLCWSRAGVVRQRCDAGGRFARCVVVIRIGVPPLGGAVVQVRPITGRAALPATLPSDAGDTPMRSHREDRAVNDRLSCYTPHFPAPSWFYSPHAEFCFPAAPVTRCRRERFVSLHSPSDSGHHIRHCKTPSSEYERKVDWCMGLDYDREFHASPPFQQAYRSRCTSWLSRS